MKKITLLLVALFLSTSNTVVKAQLFQNGQSAVYAISATAPNVSGSLGTSATNLSSPVLQTCFAIDAKHGCVWVADYFGYRVLRYSYPITSNLPTANLVLGQTNFTSAGYGASATQFGSAQGLALDTASGTLYVLAIGQNRILRFDNAHAITTNGAAANAVFGQSNFTSTGSGTSQNQFNMTQGPACGNLLHYDQLTGALWVSDNNNARVLRFDNANTASSGANASMVLGQTTYTTNTAGLSDVKFGRPDGITTIGSSLFLADPTYARVLRFDNVYSKANGAAADAVFGQTNFTSGGGGVSATKFSSPTDLSGDQNNLIVSDPGSSRILVFGNPLTNTTANNVLLSTSVSSSGTGGNSAATGGANYDIEYDAKNGQLFVQDRQNARILVFQSCPAITISGPSTICNGAAVTLSASGVTSYTWFSSETTSSISLSPTGSNSYSVLGQFAGNTYTCFTSASKSITVNQVPSLSINSGSICAGQSFTLSASGADTYTYSGGQIVNPTTTTSYSVTGTSLAGCTSTAPAVATVSVSALPVISVNSGSICAGSNFTISTSGASTYTIQGGNAIVSPSSLSTYTVIGTNADGCVSANAATCTVNVNALPTISVNSGTICSGNAFTISPSGASTYTIQGGNAIVSPNAATSYTVIGKDNNGCNSANTVTAVVSVNTSPTISVNSGAICSGTSFTISPLGAASYSISGGNSVVSPSTATTYTVRGYSAQGCSSANTASAVVMVYATPTISVNSGSICSGDNFTITPNGASTYLIEGGNSVVSPLSSANYTVLGISSQGCVSANTATASLVVNNRPTISVNSGTICSGAAFTIAPSGAATYVIEGGNAVVSPTTNSTYTINGISAEGCSAISIVTSSVTVNALPVISVNNGTICEGASFTITPSGAATYTIEGNNAVVSPSTSTAFTVIGESTQGCLSSNTATSNITVNAKPVIAINNAAICIGSTYTLSPTGAANYTFSNGSVVSPTTTSNYTINGSSSAGCSANAVVVTLSVNALPVVSVSASSNQMCVNEATVQLSGTPSGGVYSGACNANGIFSPTLSGNYQVVYQYTDNVTGCSSSATKSLTVDACTGITQLADKSSVSVYPNPTQSLVKISCKIGTISKVCISDLSGRVISTTTCSNNESEIDLSSFSNGIYLLNITGTDQTTTIKIVKY